MVINRGPRAQIAIPAQGLIEFKDQLSELLDQFGTSDVQSMFFFMNKRIIHHFYINFYFREFFKCFDIA